MKAYTAREKIQHFFISNAVPIIFIVMSAVAIPLSGFSATYLVQEMLIRLARNSFLVLSLIIPIVAGMGLNFGMVLGAMAGQIGLILVSDWAVVGMRGLLLAAMIATPIAIGLGYVCGAVLNRAKGREMVTSYILGFFVNGIYQLTVLYAFGKIVPISNSELVLSRGFGIRNAINLAGMRHALDYLVPLKIGNLSVPVGTYLTIALFCLFIVWFRRTKLGQDMLTFLIWPEKTSPVAPSMEMCSPSLTVIASPSTLTVNAAAALADVQAFAAGDAGQAGAAGNDSGVRRGAAVLGQDALGGIHAVHVVGRRFVANQDDGAALGGFDGAVGLEDGHADAGARRGVEALGQQAAGLDSLGLVVGIEAGQQAAG